MNLPEIGGNVLKFSRCMINSFPAFNDDSPHNILG